MVVASGVQLMSLNEAMGRPDRPIGEEELAGIAYRPTVVIGLGGSGASIVRRLKRRVIQHFPQQYLSMFQFMAIDTDEQRTDDGEVALNDDEFFRIPIFNAAEVIANLDTNPYLKSWWPKRKRDGKPHPVTFNSTGAHQQRAIGRLTLFQYLNPDIRQFLQQKILESVAFNNNRETAATSAKVYVVGSVAGGTGSGMFLDIAYIMRDEFRAQVNFPTYVTGLLLMPDVFARELLGRANEIQQTRANSYAALRELNHLMTTRTFAQSYAPHHVVEFGADGGGEQRPFDICYLVGLGNARHVLPSVGDVFEMCAIQLMQEILTPMQGMGQSIVDNQAQLQRFIQSQPTAYSSFATGSLQLPRRGMAAWFALRAAPLLIEQGILTNPAKPDEIAGQVKEFLTQLHLNTRERLTAQVCRDEYDRPLAAPQVDEGELEGLSIDEKRSTIQAAKKRVDEELQQVKERVRPREAVVLAERRRMLRERVDELVVDAHCGPRYAASWLATLEDELRKLGQQCQQRTTALNAERDRKEKEYNDAYDQLNEAASKWYQRGKQKRLPTDCVTAINAYISADFDATLLSHAQQIYAELGREAGQISKQLTEFITAMEEASRQYRDRATSARDGEEITRDRYLLARDITTPEDKQRLFLDHAPGQPDPEREHDDARRRFADEHDRINVVTQFWQHVRQHCPDWRLSMHSHRLGEKTPVAQAFYFLSEWFATRMQGYTLLSHVKEAVVATQWGEPISRRFNDLEPFWQWTAAEYDAEVRASVTHMALVGYGESPQDTHWDAEIREATGKAFTAVNTRDAATLIVSRIEHGRPLFSLTAMRRNGAWRQAYETLKARWDAGEQGAVPLHILPFEIGEIDAGKDGRPGQSGLDQLMDIYPVAVPADGLWANGSLVEEPS